MNIYYCPWNQIHSFKSVSLLFWNTHI